MSEQNKAVIRRMIEDHWNKKNPALVGFNANTARHFQHP